MDFSFKDIQRHIEKVMSPMKRRVSMIVGRAVLSAVADDSKKLQSLQCDFLSDETLSNLERFQQYGFTSVPFSGSEAVAVFPNGNRDHGLVIAVDDRRYRLVGLSEGEVALYTDEGDKIHIKRGGTIEIIAATEVKIQTESALVEATSAVVTADTVDVDSAEINLGGTGLEAVLLGESFQSLFNSHTHNGNLGAPTGPPLQPSTVSELSQVVSTE